MVKIVRDDDGYLIIAGSLAACRSCSGAADASGPCATGGPPPTMIASYRVAVAPVAKLGSLRGKATGDAVL